ncbi:hypothetical protein [Comamonas odontotermitis]|uniref:hypothetical protein n=1 Tax=Comamonas odontotermitis TaxID=379895 RepID=UPI001CC55853|nr:hypothetical protein [Comamonas odontotermitis]UBB19519.1 hypothetical protein LAD35_22200 [Comamonas odontotermitis]
MKATASAPEPSAHVCTALRLNSIWIKHAAQMRQSSEKLFQKFKTARSKVTSDALWDGHHATLSAAKSSENQAIEDGALLHIGVPGAVDAAVQIEAARWKASPTKTRAAACTSTY